MCAEQYGGDPKTVTSASESWYGSVLGQRERKGGEGTPRF